MVVVVGRYLLDGVIRIIARTRVKEAMTACALLTVVGVTLVMEQAGLSASLGAFIAGVLLADSDYRHEIEADIAPFEGLLLGLFFTAVGMSLNLGLIGREPASGRRHRRRACWRSRAACSTCSAGAPVWRPGPSRRFALAIAQGGEFAFVLFTAGLSARRAREAGRRPAVGRRHAVDGGDAAAAAGRRDAARRSAVVARAFDALPENDGHVVIAGFGRVGQIVARILPAKRIPFTALDSDPEQVDGVRKFGAAHLLRRRQPARDPGRGADGQGARLRAGDRQRRSLASDRADGAPALSARADLRPLAPPPAHPPA